MNDLIEALQILAKYANDDACPTHCEHDEFNVCAGIELDMVSEEDVARLSNLGFFWSEKDDCFCSFRFGSC